VVLAALGAALDLRAAYLIAVLPLAAALAALVVVGGARPGSRKGEEPRWATQ
jgi:hypothetical protein